MTEAKLWRQLNQLQKSNKNWHFCRIESSTINGIPDVNGCVNGVDVWYELKANKVNNYGLSKYQINWHIKRQRGGGRVFILHLPRAKGHLEILRVTDSGAVELVTRSRSRSRSRLQDLVLYSVR